jgi:hypothetical protein
MLSGWRRFAGEVSAVPELLTQDVWMGLEDDKQLAAQVSGSPFMPPTVVSASRARY